MNDFISTIISFRTNDPVLWCICLVFESHFTYQRSIKPKTRFERRSLKDKVALEKNRIKQRTGFAARIHNANAPETSAGLTSCVTGGAGYLSNSDRFHTDVVGEEYANRMQEMEKKKQVAEFKRKVVSLNLFEPLFVYFMQHICSARTAFCRRLSVHVRANER